MDARQAGTTAPRVRDCRRNALLEECRQRGWQVIHLHIGNQATAQAMSDTYGISANQTITANKENLATTLQKVAEKRAAYAKSGQGYSLLEMDVPPPQTPG
jgi:hypothetical protein